jgi:hypothetical protein
MPRALPLAFALLVLACSSQAPGAFAGPPNAEIAPSLTGIPDRGYDPAIVLLNVAGQGWCTGTLLEEDVVLTARLCVELPAGSLSCPATGPQVSGTRDLTTVSVLVGDTVATAVERARGQDVILPPGDDLCGDDLALLLLDSTIDDIAPVLVSPTGAAQGDHVRSVAFGGGVKLVRDHVPVAATSSAELELSEAPCVGSPGGAALDETTGELVGVVSRSGPACGDAVGWDVATRPDAFYALIEEALSRGQVSHATDQAKDTKGPVDLGAGCAEPSRCAAGVCVTYSGAEYCTQLCSPSDPCPSDYTCTASTAAATVCIHE